MIYGTPVSFVIEAPELTGKADVEIIDAEDFLAVGRYHRGCLSRQVGVGCHATGPAACTS